MKKFQTRITSMFIIGIVINCLVICAIVFGAIKGIEYFQSTKAGQEVESVAKEWLTPVDQDTLKVED